MTEQEKEQFEFYKDLFADQQRMFDKARESNFSLWNSLLSFNAIIITVFSAFLALNKNGLKTILFSIILGAILSAVLIIYNFKSTKDFYFKSAKDYFNRIDRIEAMTEIEAQKYHSLDLNKIEKRQRIVNYFEMISIILVFMELILIIIFLFYL